MLSSISPTTQVEEGGKKISQFLHTCHLPQVTFLQDFGIKPLQMKWKAEIRVRRMKAPNRLRLFKVSSWLSLKNAISGNSLPFNA